MNMLPSQPLAGTLALSHDRFMKGPWRFLHHAEVYWHWCARCAIARCPHYTGTLLL